MNEDVSPAQTPTVASIGQRRQTMQPSKSSPLAVAPAVSSSSTLPVTPETATFANTAQAAKRNADATASAPIVQEPNPNVRPSSTRASTRARDLLRQHYGMGLIPPASMSGRPDDPMDIDSKVFDAKAYYEQLITTTSLTGLLKKENELSAQIRQLDGERQSLVYNHHHELIAASDTISAMKTQADGLDSDLEKLRMAFSDISRLIAEVTNDQAQDRRDRDS
ncbi:hypothetical protein FRC17_000946 [Serendipita sp. 399]|nr:hypothetical protein FRC17_000946 [Serendipita sp. 399]